MNAGKGYRLLKVGEIIRKGDEYYAMGVGPWMKVVSFWIEKPWHKGLVVFRRKLSKKPAKKTCKGCIRYSKGDMFITCTGCTRNPAAKLSDNYRRG